MAIFETDAVMPRRARLCASVTLTMLVAGLLLLAGNGWAKPVAHNVAVNHSITRTIVGGKAVITQRGATTLIRQTSPTLVLDWPAFHVERGATVVLKQPSPRAIAVIRAAGTRASEILGHVQANGRVLLINPHGITFGAASRVTSAALVASSIALPLLEPFADASSLVLRGGSMHGKVVNQGVLRAADGGYVALIGGRVSNRGTIQAPGGSVALGAGSAVNLQLDGDRLLDLQVQTSALHALAENHQRIEADGGQVLVVAGAPDSVLASAVRNTGTIQARSVGQHIGQIALLAGARAGTTRVAGTLDASAARGATGGDIETSAAHVHVDDSAHVSTLASRGKNGTWLIDPHDFTIGPGGDMTATQVETALVSTNLVIQSSSGSTSGPGDINVETALNWNANTLALEAVRNINMNAPVTTAGSAGLVLHPATTNGGETAVATGTTIIGAAGSLTLGGSGSLALGDITNNGALTFNLDNDFTYAGVISGSGSLTHSGTGILTLGGNVTTTGASQTYNGAVALGNNITLTGTPVTLHGVTGNGHDLDVAGNAVLAGALTGVNKLSINGTTTLGADISTSGNQNYYGGVTLGSNVTLTSTDDQDINLASTVDGAHALTVDTGGAATFDSAVGGTTMLASLTADGGDTTLDGNVTTSGAQSYNGLLTLGNNITLTGTPVTLHGVTGNGHDLDVAGNAALAGTANVSNLTVSGTVAFNASGGTTGNLTANALDYSGYGTPVTFDLSAGSGLSTGIGGTWNGAATVAGSGHSDTITGAGQTYQLTGTNAGNTGAVNWTSFENLSDATGTVDFGAVGSVSGNVTAQTLDYGSYLQGLTLNVSTGAITNSGVGGTLSGYNTINANAAQTNTVTGSGATYTLSGSDAGSSGSNVWSAFQNVNDATGSVDFGTAGSVTGTLTASTLDYMAYATPVTVHFSGTGSTGIGSTLSGVSAVNAATHLAISGNVGGALDATTSGALTVSGALTGTDVSLTGQSGITLGDNVATTGTLTLASTNAAIQQTGGALTVIGATTADAGSGAITLAGTNNDFQDLVALTGGVAQITDQNALALATLDTGDLTVSSTGALNLGSGTIAGDLGATSNGGAITQSGALAVTGVSTIDAGSGSIALANANNDFSAAVNVSGAGISMTDKNDLHVTQLTGGANGGVSLIAGGTLSLPAGAINTGTGDLILASRGGTLTAPATLSGGNITLDGRDGLTLSDTINATGIASITSSSGAISQTGGILDAATLTGSSAGATTLNQANQLDTLGSFSAASFALTNAQALAVAGPVNGGPSTALTTTSGNLVVNGALAGTATTLASAGAISEGSAGVITAATLTGSSVGNTTLNGANQIDTLGSFSAANFVLTNARALAVSGPLMTTGGTGNIQLATTSGALNASTDLSGGDVALASAGNLAVGGDVTANQASLTAPAGTIGGAISTSGGLSIAAAPGLMQVQSGATVTGVTQLVNGTLQVDGGASITAVTVDAGATLTGVGSAGAIVNNGSVVPGTTGAPYGSLAATSYTDAGGTLRIAADAASGSNSKLNISGAATLSGLLLLDLGGSQPAPGDSFDVLSANPVNHQFASVSAVGSQIVPNTVYSSSRVTVKFGQVIAPYTPVPTLDWRMLLLLATLLSGSAALRLRQQRRAKVTL